MIGLDTPQLADLVEALVPEWAPAPPAPTSTLPYLIQWVTIDGMVWLEGQRAQQCHALDRARYLSGKRRGCVWVRQGDMILARFVNRKRLDVGPTGRRPVPKPLARVTYAQARQALAAGKCAKCLTGAPVAGGTQCAACVEKRRLAFEKPAPRHATPRSTPAATKTVWVEGEGLQAFEVVWDGRGSLEPFMNPGAR